MRDLARITQVSLRSRRSFSFPLSSLATDLHGFHTENARVGVQDSPPLQGVGAHFVVLSLSHTPRGVAPPMMWKHSAIGL